MRDIDFIRKAREIISDESHWTRGELARDARGDDVPPLSPRAHCFCAVGALARATKLRTDTVDSARIMNQIRRVCGIDFLSDYNDSHTHAEVLAMFDKTIRALEKEEAKK